eukprot:1206106-Alexandrium_andersonii.AAC.1
MQRIAALWLPTPRYPAGARSEHCGLSEKSSGRVAAKTQRAQAVDTHCTMHLERSMLCTGVARCKGAGRHRPSCAA